MITEKTFLKMMKKNFWRMTPEEQEQFAEWLLTPEGLVNLENIEDRDLEVMEPEKRERLLALYNFMVCADIGLSVLERKKLFVRNEAPTKYTRFYNVGDWFYLDKEQPLEATNARKPIQP